jgi:hypothetical protein
MSLWTCVASEHAARAILRAFESCLAAGGELGDVSEVLRCLRGQHPQLVREFPELPWTRKPAEAL